jgi:5'-nucleotidase
LEKQTPSIKFTKILILKTLIEILKEIQPIQYEIYCDMDGVLCDFDERFKFFSGESPTEYKSKNGTDKFWDIIDEAGVGFWAGMKWMSDGKQLWDYISSYNPTLLSAPSSQSESRLGKRLWVKKHLPGVKLILSKASDKKNYSKPFHILIDDRASNIEDWRNEGGVGILHTSTFSTIKELQKLGI